MYTLIFLSLFLLLVVYFLFLPIVLLIDTNSNQYYIHLKGLAKINIESDPKELLKLKLHVFFINYYIYPLRTRTSSKKKTAQRKKTKNKLRLGTILKLIKSFKVKKLKINMDTGNCITNAKWYPVFYFLNYKFGGFNINFEEKNQLVLCLQNRPIRIIKSFINI